MITPRHGTIKMCLPGHDQTMQLTFKDARNYRAVPWFFRLEDFRGVLKDMEYQSFEGFLFF